MEVDSLLKNRDFANEDESGHGYICMSRESFSLLDYRLIIQQNRHLIFFGKF